ncbi:MAG: rod-binding protein [Armatimonadota bacterium]
MMRIEHRANLDTQRWKLREATQQMEAQFLHHLLRAMRRTVPSTQTSYVSQMYTDMLDEALAQQLARSDQFGLGKLLYEKLSAYLQTPERESAGGGEDETR